MAEYNLTGQGPTPNKATGDLVARVAEANEKLKKAECKPLKKELGTLYRAEFKSGDVELENPSGFEQLQKQIKKGTPDTYFVTRMYKVTDTQLTALRPSARPPAAPHESERYDPLTASLTSRLD